MNDHPDLVNSPHVDSVESTDERLHRVERALAALQDTQLMEQRLLERVAQKLDQQPASDSHVLPGVVRAVGAHLDAATSPTAPHTSVFSAKTWILTDMIQEIRTFFVLYFDYRYRVSYPARIIPVVALVVFILGWVMKSFLGMDNFFGTALQHLMNLLLFIVVYKTLQREAARYRAQFAYLPPI